MKVRTVNWQNHEAILIESGSAQFIITTSVGPRIVSLKYNGSGNLFYEDASGFGVGDWRLYGGHRFTIAPETAESYYPDNEGCTVHVRLQSSNIVEDSEEFKDVKDTQRYEGIQASEVFENFEDFNISASSVLPGTAVAVAAIEAVLIKGTVRNDHLQLAIEIIRTSDDCSFRLIHRLINHGTTCRTGALWAITCIPRAVNVVAACNTAKIRLWDNTEPGNWSVADGLMHLQDGDFRGKTGWHQHNGWLATIQQKISLTIFNLDTSIPAECTDDGCNLEIFACKDWIELETLGRIVTITPGGVAAHQQQWVLTEPNQNITNS